MPVFGRAGRRMPLQGFAVSRLTRAVVAAVRVTLTGFLRLSEFHSVRRSGELGPPPPPRRVHGHEVFRRPACSWTRRSGATPAGSRPSQGPLPRSGTRPHGRVHPLLGFSSPSTTSESGSVRSRGLPPRHDPSSRFLTSSTVSLPAPLAATRAAAVHGVPSLIRDLSERRAAMRRRIARDPLPQGFRSLRSETQGERHHDAGSLEALRPGAGVVTPPMPRPRGAPLRSSSSRPAAATGVAAIPLVRFSPPGPQ